MLAQAKAVFRELGLTELLITCPEHNVRSRRVIEANDGVLERIDDGEARYRVPT
jgi:predicted acetyltransferase